MIPAAKQAFLTGWLWVIGDIFRDISYWTMQNQIVLILNGAISNQMSTSSQM